MTKFSKGPWRACHNGECSCFLVWGGERDGDEDGTHPVATVKSGAWGDTYPAIRYIEGEGMSGTKVEAYLERIDYGTIPEAIAKANTRLIAAAPELYEALEAAKQFIENGVELGYISLPNSPDPALETLPMIVAALAKAEGGVK